MATTIPLVRALVLEEVIANPLYAEDHESVKTYIGVFPCLRGLHVSAPQQPHLDSREWTPNPLCRATLLEALTELRTTQPVAARMLPKIFFLPNLHTLEATVLDARDIGSWSVPPGAQPWRAGIVHLFLTAGLTSHQLLQLLSWPAALRSFVYHHKSCPGSYALVPTTNAFKTALQPFRRSLVALKVAILDSYVNGVDTVDEDLQFNHEESRCPYLDMSSFYSLKDLQLPSHFLVGYPRNDYMRDNIPDLLPSSLRSFEINFGPDDLFLSRDWHQHVWGFPLQHRPFNSVGNNRWLYALSQYSLKGGPFSHLQNIVVSDTGRTEAWGQAAGLRRTFAGIDVHIHVALASPPMYLQEDGEEYQNREDWSDYWENGAPIFGQELTEHSSSPRGTEIEWLEQEYEEEMLLMDEWEGFDAMMAGERERLSESWVKGQWPDYEDSREERDEMFR